MVVLAWDLLPGWYVDTRLGYEINPSSVLLLL